MQNTIWSQMIITYNMKMLSCSAFMFKFESLECFQFGKAHDQLHACQV